ncbi:MAG: hypothetical protein RL094_264 [Candidatus Parcubacteria bacterium]|jgi:predicted PurR-regulated permease PerM
MTQTRTQVLTYTIAFIIVFVLSVLIFWPFLTVLAMAAVMAVVVGPVNKWIYKKVGHRENISALLSLIFVLIVILLPLALLGSKLISEAQAMYVNIVTNPDVSIDKISSIIQENGQKIYKGFNFNIQEYVAFFSAWIVDHLGGIFSGTIDFILKLVLGFVALFYFLRDGITFKRQLVAFSPLSDDDDRSIISSVRSSVRSVVLGSFIIAIIQGLLAGIGFAIFGVPNSTLWGTTAAVAALIPGVGTAVVWVPSVIYLFFAKASFAWVGLLIWSVFLVGLIDNYLGPKIIEKGVNIHPLLILFSILGGLSFFGAEGFLLGPLVLSLLFALVRVYQQGNKSGTHSAE